MFEEYRFPQKDKGQGPNKKIQNKKFSFLYLALGPLALSPKLKFIGVPPTIHQLHQPK